MSTPGNRPRTSSSLDASGTAQLTPERWQQIKEVFAAAQEHNPGERDEFVQKACGGDQALLSEVASLLAAAEPESADAGGRAETRRWEDAMIGRRVGAYEILRRIGRGGMATVYLAARADEQFEKRVAVKILLPELDSDDLLRRFRNERQTLAKLDHPNIVKLLDGGSTEEGLPYLVMDYVDGLPIDQYCDERKLSTDERLRLFCQVCAAVECAHQNFVIHRDLKPSNILVTSEGIPKLLDFGISKVLHPDSKLLVTHSATRRMTPAYASPEQVRSEQITPATDIYSLGVVLYELLTGHRPYRLRQNTPAEVERAICEQDPEKPSTAVNRIEADTLPDGTTVSKTPEVISAPREGQADKLRRRLRGDLDNIVLTALQKDPQRRYHSVEDLSRDIQRHLQHLPVTARHSTLAYRTSKFVRRHTTEVVASGVMMIILLAAISFVIFEQRQAVERARQELSSQRSHSRRSVAVLGFRNLSARPDTAWLSTALSEMLTTELAAGGKLRTIPGESVAQAKINLSLPEEDALSPATLGRVYKNLGSDFVVLGSYLDMRDSGRGLRLDLRVQDAALQETIASLTETGSETSLPDLVIRTGAALRQRLGVAGPSAVEAASVQASLSANPEATRLYAEGLARIRVFDAMGAKALLEKAVMADPNYAMAHSALADACNTLGYETKAQQEAKKALDLAGSLSREESLWVEGHLYRITQAWDKASKIYGTLFSFFPDNLDYGLRLAEAQGEAGHFDESLATIQALRKLPSPTGGDARIDLVEGSNADSAADFDREIIAATRAQQKGESLGARLIVAEALYLQCHGLRSRYDTQKAFDACSRAEALFAQAEDQNGEANVLRLIGLLHEDQNDAQGAREAYVRALQLYHQLGNLAGEILVLSNLGELYTWQKDFDKATTMFERSLILAQKLGDPHRAAISLMNLGAAEKQKDDFAHAKEHLRESLTQGRHYGDKNLIAWSLMSLADISAAGGDSAAAKKTNEEVLTIFRQIGVQMNIAGGLQRLADLELSMAEIKSANQHYSESFQIFKAIGQQLASSYPMCALGDILFAAGDLDGARKKYTEALAIREKLHGNARYIFDNRIKLARLSLEEGNAPDAETSVRQALSGYSAQNEPSARIEADKVMVQALLAQKKVASAQEVVAGDRRLILNSENRANVLQVDIIDALVTAAAGNSAEAARSLQTSIEETQRNGFTALQLEARLALGETELKKGDITAARTTFNALQRDAKRLGFFLIARKGATAIREH